MKKRTIGLTCLCLLACAGLGAGVGASVYSEIHQNNIVMVRAEDGTDTTTSSEDTTTDETTSEEVPSEEESKLQSLIDELKAKYEELKEVQIFGTTVGAIIGAVVGAVVALAPSLLNRANIKKALDEVDLTRRIVDDNKALAEKIKEDYGITNKNYDKAIEAMEEVSKSLDSAQKQLKVVMEENEKIKEENAELKDILLNIVSHTKELVATGIAEKLNSKYNK